jgi:hypothetical protein
MADIKISQLTAKGSPIAPTDLVEIAEDDGFGNYSSKSVSGLQPTLVSGTDIITINSATLLTSGNVNLQPTLVSATNIKTINSNSLLGSGDLVVGGALHVLTKPVSGRTYSIRTDSTTASSSAVSVANTIYLSPFIPANSITISNLQINVVSLAVGASARILVYSDSNGIPTTKLIESTTLDCSTSGAKTFTTSYTFTAGTTYWLGVYTNNALFQMSTISLGNTIPVSTNAFSSAYTSLTASATFGSAPTTLGTATLNTTNMYVINLTAA